MFTRRDFMLAAAASVAASCATSRRLAAFTFAAVSDTHVAPESSSADIVRRAVQSINAGPAEFTVLLGDVTRDGSMEQLELARDVLTSLSRPVHVLPGNHDLHTPKETPYHNFERVFGPTNWVFRHKAWVFVGLNTCGTGGSDVALSPDRLAWLEDTVRTIRPDEPIVLLGHHPFNPTTRAYRIRNADQALALFNGHNLRLVATGHFHGNQVEERNGTMFSTTACCASTRTNHDGTSAKGYRLFHVNGETLNTEFVEVEQ